MDKIVITEDLKQLLTLEQRIDSIVDQIDQLNVQVRPMETAVKIDEIFEIAETRRAYYNRLMELQHKLRDLEEEKYNLSLRIIEALPLDNQKILVESQDRGKIIVEKKVDPYGKEEPVLVIERDVE